MVVRSIKKITPYIWISPEHTPEYKVTVTRHDGTVDDITDILMDLSIEDGTTNSIGIFSFKIPNGDQAYLNAWTGMETFRFYADYATTATTLRFKGRIERPSAKLNGISVNGRSEALFVQDQEIIKTYDEVDAGAIIKDMFDTYGEDRFDTSAINVNTGKLLTLAFAEIPFWDAIEDICSGSGYDCYINAENIVMFFEAGSIINTVDAIVHDFNLLEVGDFAPDLQFVVNKVRVTGATVDGVQVMYTANNLESQEANGIRKYKIEDKSITTIAEAKELAEFNLQEAPIVIDVTGLLIGTIQPGEMLRLSSPLEGLAPGNYRVVKYKHEMTDGFIKTKVSVNKEVRRLSNIIKNQLQRESKGTNSLNNPEDLDFAEIELFNSDTGSHTDTEIVDGILKPTASSGTWISKVYNTVDGNSLSKMRVGLVADNISGASIGVSTDGGDNYINLSSDVLQTGLGGKSFIIKLTLTGTTTQVDSMRIQYSTA